MEVWVLTSSTPPPPSPEHVESAELACFLNRKGHQVESKMNILFSRYPETQILINWNKIQIFISFCSFSFGSLSSWRNISQIALRSVTYLQHWSYGSSESSDILSESELSGAILWDHIYEAFLFFSFSSPHMIYYPLLCSFGGTKNGILHMHDYIRDTHRI